MAQPDNPRSPPSHSWLRVRRSLHVRCQTPGWKSRFLRPAEKQKPWASGHPPGSPNPCQEVRPAVTPAPSCRFGIRGRRLRHHRARPHESTLDSVGGVTCAPQIPSKRSSAHTIAPPNKRLADFHRFLASHRVCSTLSKPVKTAPAPRFSECPDEATRRSRRRRSRQCGGWHPWVFRFGAVRNLQSGHRTVRKELFLACPFS